MRYKGCSGRYIRRRGLKNTEILSIESRSQRQPLFHDAISANRPLLPPLALFAKAVSPLDLDDGALAKFFVVAFECLERFIGAGNVARAIAVGKGVGQGRGRI